MIHLELCWSFGITNNHRIDGRVDDRQENARHQQADNETNQKSRAAGVVPAHSGKETGINRSQEPPNEATGETNAHRHHEHNIVGKIVRDNDRPALLLKQMQDIATSLNVVESLCSWTAHVSG